MTDSSYDHKSTIQTLLGFDFGLQKIGIATGQCLTRSATPLTIIKAKEGKPDWSALDPLIKEWQPDQLVVGNPLNMDGTESELSRRAQKFARRLAARYSLPVTTMDERLSTREAREQAAAYDHSGQVDAIAAAIIVENWLNSTTHPNSG